MLNLVLKQMHSSWQEWNILAANKGQSACHTNLSLLIKGRLHIRGINNSLAAKNEQRNQSDAAVQGYMSQDRLHAAALELSCSKTTN